MNSPIVVDYILVCDDIRQEVGRKPSAMGIYTDNILVQGFPFMFVKLCFLVHFHVVRRVSKFIMTASFEYTGKKPLVLAENQEVPIARKGQGGVLNFSVAALKLDRAGIGKFTVEIADRKFRQEFTVRKATEPDAFR